MFLRKTQIGIGNSFFEKEIKKLGDIMSPLTNASVLVVEENGNSFFIVSRVRTAILKSDKPELAEEFIKEAMSGDRNNVLLTRMKYVDVY